MSERILLPTDVSAGVNRAVEHAVDAARRDDAELYVLYVVDSPASSSDPGDESVHEFEGLEAALEQAGREAVDAIADRAEAAGVPTETESRHGVPREEILRYVDAADVDLTVIGTKNRPGEYRRLLGSVAELVANMSQRPVTIVKTQVDGV